MYKKWLQLTIIILAVVLFVGGGGYWWKIDDKRPIILSNDTKSVLNNEKIDHEIMNKETENIDNKQENINNHRVEDNITKDQTFHNWEIYHNQIYNYQIQYPPTWKIDNVNHKKVELSVLDTQGDALAWVKIEIEEKQPDIELIDWIESSVNPLPPDREVLEIVGGQGWSFVGNAGPYGSLMNYFVRDGENSLIFNTTCTAKYSLANCIDVINSFEFTMPYDK